MRILVLSLLIACSAKSSPPSNAPSGSAQTGSGSAQPAYTGSKERGPCQDAHECHLRNNCGCSCDAVVFSAPKSVACEESCPNPDPCKDHSLICDLATHTCGAIPRAP